MRPYHTLFTPSPNQQNNWKKTLKLWYYWRYLKIARLTKNWLIFTINQINALFTNNSLAFLFLVVLILLKLYPTITDYINCLSGQVDYIKWLPRSNDVMRMDQSPKKLSWIVPPSICLYLQLTPLLAAQELSIFICIHAIFIIDTNNIIII